VSATEDMKHKPSIHLAICLLLSAILACNVPNTAQPVSVNDQAATGVAATLQAVAGNAGDVPITAAFSLTPNLTPSSVNSPTATGTITPTYSVPMLTVREQTNCRTGPGLDYEVIFTYLPNKKLEIVGRYDPDNYWLVKSVESAGGVCWLWGEYVDVAGSYWVVSSVTPPPTATKKPLQAPSIQNWNFFCSAGQMTITIDWTDRAVDETGYRVFRNGELVAELPANSTTYTDLITLNTGDSAEYYIQVYNATSTANSSLMKVAC